MPKLTESAIQQALEYAYEKAFDGFPGADSAIELAQSYKEKYPSDKLKQANALINWQIAAGATSGFITGLGGLMTFPVSIPANLASVLFIQTRMIMSIAVIGGHDPKDDRVKTLVLSCLAGNAVKDILKEVGIEAGKKIILKTIAGQISQGTLTRVSRVVSFRLLAKFGTNLGKLIPLIGGIIGGTMDAVWVASVGKIAKQIFISDSEILPEEENNGVSH